MPKLAQPRDGEPIKIVQTGAGPRYEATVTTSPRGAAKRTQSRKRFKTLREARDFIRKTYTQVHAGDHLAKSAMTFAELVQAWAASKVDVRTISRDGYLQVLKPLVRDHGTRPVQSITRQELDAWRATWPVSGGIRGKGLKQRSIQLTIQALKLVFGYAVEVGVIKASPANGMKVPRETLTQKSERRRMDAVVWDFAELKRFVAEADQTEVAAAMRLSACGLRRSEVLGLTWGAVDLEKGTVHVRQGRAKSEIDEVKSKASDRVIRFERMMPGTADLLRKLKADQAAQKLAGGAGGWISDLVVTTDLGMPYDRDVYSDQFRKIAEAAGLPAVHLHSIRHAIATELHRRGVPVAAAAKLLGHSVEVHMKVYLKIQPKDLDEAADAFREAYAETA